MVENVWIDSTDLRGAKLLKIKDTKTNVTIMFSYYRDSDATNGKLMLPPNAEIDLQTLLKVIVKLEEEYPMTNWKTWINKFISEEELIAAIEREGV